jgi:phage tail sheath protein FI
MPIKPTYPGVYIEEIPSGVKTIIGVSTSIAAFIDYFKYGEMNKAIQILNMGDFEREFGGLDSNSEASYAIQQFFLNGGNEAWVVRTASGTVAKSQVNIWSDIIGRPNASHVLSVEAISEGDWGNNLQVKIDYNTTGPDLFNMNVSMFKSVQGALRISKSEVFSNLSMDPTNLHYVEKVVNDKDSGSKLIRVSKKSTDNALPLQNGTVSGDLSVFSGLTATEPRLKVSIGTEGTGEATLDVKSINKPSNSLDLKDVRSLLEKAIRSSKPDKLAFAGATVEIFQNRLRVLAGPTSGSSTATFSVSDTNNPTLKELKLDSSSVSVKGVISGNLKPFPTAFTANPCSLDVTIGGGNPETITFEPPTSLSDARTKLENAIKGVAAGNPAFKDARVAEYSTTTEDLLIVLAGTADSDISFAANSDTETLDKLKLDTTNIKSINSVVSGDLTATFPTLTASSLSVNLTIGAEGPHTVTLSAKPTDLATARDELEKAIRAADTHSAFTGARVASYSAGNERRLIVAIENGGNAVVFSSVPLDTKTVTELKLDSSNATANVQEYKLGDTAAIPQTAQGAGVKGLNGVPPNGSAMIGDPVDKTGLYALEDVDLFNILCIPRTSVVKGENVLPEQEAISVMTAAINYCKERRAIYLVDPPNNINDVQGIKDWVDRANIRDKNAAIYFPRVKIADPMSEFRLRSFGPSGTIAGLYSRTDSNRGVWKAPAGTEATLVNVQGLDYTLTDGQNGILNPLAINCLRSFPIYGKICWGARTLDGADQRSSEYKYVPVRRMALFIEESLYRGTQWVVFEPNDEPLWAQIRLNIGAFMHSLFIQGAFQGQTPKEAYFVKCDKETTTQDDINKGIVNIVVGFAPLKPAEFVIIQIQQIAGQIQT